MLGRAAVDHLSPAARQDHAPLGPKSHPPIPRGGGPTSRAPFIVASDVLALTIASAAAFDLVITPGSLAAAAPLLYPVFGILLLAIRRAYRWSPRDAALDQVLPILGGLGIATLISLAAADTGPGNPIARHWLVAWALGSLLVILQRAVIGLYHRARMVRGGGLRPTLIVGAGTIGARVARRLDGAPDYGLDPVGFLDDNPLESEIVGGRPAPVLGGLGDLDRVVAEHNVQQVIVAFSSAPDRAVVELVRRCEELGLEVGLVPRLFDLWNQRASYDPVGGLPVLHLYSTDLAGWQFVVKNVLDRAAAVIALIVLSPLLLLVAAAVRCTGPGPILFRQRRVGLDGHEFDLLKFRSMRQAGPTELPPLDGIMIMAPGGVEGADRRTSIGRCLRRSSLDELPQLFNVLRGDMSIVGPRPERPEFVDRFRPLLERYDERHRVRSGITGWSQIHGLRGRTSLADRIEMDNFYIEHFSLALDLRIIVRTIVVVFRAAE